MSLVSSPVRAAAIVLPILIVQDWVSVWAFRRDYSLAEPHHPYPVRGDRRHGSAGCLRRGSARTPCVLRSA